MSGRDGDKGYGGLRDGDGEGKVHEVAPRFTYRDYLKLTGDERYEVIEGALFLVPSPSVSHQEILLRVATLLNAYVRERKLGKVFVAPLDVVLSENNVLQPDVLFVSNERLGIVKEMHIAGAPDLVIEIESKSTRERDRVTKRGLYGEFGVKECWLVDPERRAIMVLGDSGGQRVFTTDGEPILASSVLPDLALAVTGVFS